MSWVRCWHHSMRRLQWCLWWTRDLGGDEGWGHISTTIISLRCNTIMTWWIIFLRSYDDFHHHGEICQNLLSFESAVFFTDQMIGTHFFSIIFWDVKNGCLTTPGADSGRLWEVFQKPHLFCAFGYTMTLWTDDPVSVADAWSILKLCQLCDSEVEIDGFFSLPHARESRFSSDSVKIWKLPRVAKLSGWNFWQVGGNRGKLWNLKHEYRRYRRYISIYPISLFFAVEKLLDLWVVWHGFEGALECQQECAKTYRCEHLGCKDVMAIEASA